MNAALADMIRQRATDLGFSHVGFALAERLEQESPRLREWLARGYAAGMSWMERQAPKKEDPREVLPGARSVIVLGMNYYHGVPYPADAARVSRYAWGDDYHEIIGVRLKELTVWLDQQVAGSRSLWYVDTGPIMEKAWAQRAGLGWQGKHTNLITIDEGSWLFLSVILTTVELPSGTPGIDRCGSCTACIDACPTHAIVEPYVLDAGKCLSYLTIEHRGPIPEELARENDQWVYGCDICQDVCPWNIKFAEESAIPGFLPRPENLAPDLDDWSNLGQEEFTRRFKGSPLKRARLEGLTRNARLLLERKHAVQTRNGG